MRCASASAGGYLLLTAVFLLAVSCGDPPPPPASGTVCDDCSSAIPVDEPYHALTLSQERQDPDGIDVQAEMSLIRLCEDCARSKDLEHGLKVFLTDEGRFVPIDTLEYVQSDNCYDCGVDLGDGPWFSLVHYHEKLVPGEEIEVIDAVGVAQFCPACRLRYDFKRIETVSH